ncbi:MAG: alkaline phosphatase family protein, partial [Acidobacteria bacterium]|nr:alkaline phosphatase family protein [Acidobacteriota bacterium]
MKTKTSSKAVAFAVTTLLVLALAPAAHAYIGPGAGFAFLSSFLILLIAFFSSVFSLVSWPLRSLYWTWRRRKVYTHAKIRRLVILGLDGMDPELATRFMDEGKLPHLARLRQQGTFQPLQTTYPPISPVAWSSFLTGVNPGQHNIYDFLARQRGSYLPTLSSAEILPPRRTLRLGKLVIPLGKPQTKMLRKSRPFWHYLGEVGIPCAVLRVPITFPPEKSRAVLLSGMCVPDLLGSQGTFFFYSTRDQSAESRRGGRQFRLQKEGDALHSYLVGPDTVGQNGNREARLPFRLRPDAAKKEAELELDGRRYRLRLGEYSEWIQLKFKVGPGLKVHGICRFLLRAVSPHVELYVTPVNIDPAKPALPISHPLTYSIYLAKLQGPFATLGLAEDTWALNEGVLDDDAFLEQAYLHHHEREQMFFDALEKIRQGLCVCVFDTTDRVQHMFWRYLEAGHPASPDGNPRYAGVIEDLYKRMDDLVGRIQAQLKDDTVFLVISDHGF